MRWATCLGSPQAKLLRVLDLIRIVLWILPKSQDQQNGTANVSMLGAQVGRLLGQRDGGLRMGPQERSASFW
jgi:hypothetical protein